MPLRREIEWRPETFADMDAASALRWREGDRLMADGEFDGAVYLLGYFVEMRLKLAAFRRLGAAPTDLVDTLRRTTGAWMRLNAHRVDAEGGHSLFYWATFLQLHRSATGPLYSRPLLRGLRWHVLANAHQEWRVEMRYRDNHLAYDDAWRVWEASWWVWEHWLQL